MKKIIAKIKQFTPRKVKYLRRKILKILQPGTTKIPQEELEVFKRIRDKLQVVFDVGAREDIDMYTIHPNCEYHLFEPNKKFFTLLKSKIAPLNNPRIKINNLGLSDVTEKECVYYQDSESFIKNRFFENIDRGERYDLEILDGYVKKHNISKIDFLKIDAEGMDYRVIQGGLDIIKNNTNFIQFEYWDGAAKFALLLGDTFDLYVMMEKGLLKAVHNEVKDEMTTSQKQKDYTQSLVPLDDDVILLIDTILAPKGFGGNIFGIKKTIEEKLSIKKEIAFDIRTIN
ncbi:MAG: FkbM family methyltransferase [Candidatus Paceibacterota bacterium]